MPTIAEDTAEVERLTQTLIRVLNSRNFEYQDPDGRELVNHVASDFEAWFSNCPHSLDFKGQTEHWKEDARDYPSLHFSVLETTTRVQRRSQTATVYLKLALTGISVIQFQGACKLEWAYRENCWLLCRHVNMRGPLLDGLTF